MAPSISIRNLLSVQKYMIFIFIIFLILVGYRYIPSLSLRRPVDSKGNIYDSRFSLQTGSNFSNNNPSSARVLVVYVYAKTHALAEQNLAFFIRNAVHNSHHADYYFILQQMDNKYVNETTLPLLPSNAHYIHHENKCFDIGTIGWFLSRGIIDKTKYKYFIFLNSSVRGPFIVSYYDNPIWYTIFTRRLNDHIKLVGCTINCEIAPHVQSYLWALDFEGLTLLLKNGTIFACYGKKDDTINNAEVGASQIILNSNFGIDSLMKKHQGVDFRLKINHKCNDMTIPTFNKRVDGISLDPFEVVFVKIKDKMAEYQDNRERVRAYEKWMH
jgi:hypothetical protein